jgi:glycerol-3-phosphate O-acyltransferase
VLPENPIDDLKLDTSKKIVYVMRTRSTTSFTMLKQQSEALGLPVATYLRAQDREIPSGAVFFIQHKPIFGRKPSNIIKYSKLLETLIEQHKDNPEDLQIVPVSLYWGRNPGKEKSLFRLFFTDTESANPIRKLFLLVFQGRNSFMQFGKPIELNKLPEYSNVTAVVRKITRTLRVYFHRQRQTTMGPLVFNRKQLITSLLANDEVIAAVKREQKKRNISYKKSQKLALKYANEIAASYTYMMIRLGSAILAWVWNKIYGGVTTLNIERVRDVATDHEIVYMPCHRSHIDYLLLSYVLYNEGLVAPHIAAGINLNFWPMGRILRAGGAFFIRRSFSGNKLYTAIFNAYFKSLLDKGIPVEFFPEGGRSRTGRLLQPKTGMLAMLVQNYLKGCQKPIMIVPVYIGYEKMMEGKSYIKEMQGAKKKNESMGQLLKVRKQLKQRYGKVFVNFAEPISLESMLYAQDADWRDNYLDQKPTWLTPFVSQLADLNMTRINQSAVVNCVNLTSAILLSTQRHTLGKSELVNQLDLYTKLLNNSASKNNVHITDGDGESLLEEAKSLDIVFEFSNPLGNLCQLADNAAVYLTYYRNNIIHLLALPSLIASCFRAHSNRTRQSIINTVKSVYPLLKRELFLPHELNVLDHVVEHYLNQFASYGLIDCVNDEYLRAEINSDEFSQLMLLADTLTETLERYATTLTILATHAGQEPISRSQLESQSQKLTQRISALYNIYAPESFDKSLFQQIVSSLRQNQFIENQASGELKVSNNIPDLQLMILELLSQSTRDSLLKTARWANGRWGK